MKPNFFLLLFLFAFNSNAISQHDPELKIDSLKKVLPSLQDSAKVDCLNELSGIYIKLIRDTLGYCELPLCETNTLPRFSSLVSHYAELAYEEAVKMHYIHGIAESLSYKGEIEGFSEHFLSEEKFSREAINWYRKTLNKKRLAETFFNLGHSLFPQSFFAESIKNLNTAYEWHKKNGNTDGMYWTLSVSGAIYHESGNYEKAFELARKCLDIATQNKNDWFKRNSLTDIGWLFQDIEDYKTALEYYRMTSVNVKLESLGFAELFTLQHQYDSAKYYFDFADTSDLRTLRFYLTSIGEYYFLQKQYNKALPGLIRALDYHRQLNDRNPVMRTLLDIAKTYLALGNDDSAFVYGNESLSIAKQTGAKQFIRDACEILSSIYDHWRQSDSAYFYYRQYTAMKDSVLNNQVKGRFAAYTFEQKVELLNKEKQIQQVQLQKQSLLKNILIGGIIILLLLAAIIFRNTNLKRRNEKQRLEHDLELQKLESEKTKAEFQQQTTELEMQALRAQMNPHFIFNSLNAINHFILKNESETAANYLIKFSRLIRMVLNNSQKSFIPLEDELESLQLYVDLEKLRCKNSFDYANTCSSKIDAANICIPPLILQPFVENAIWHGLMHKETKGKLEIDITFENELLCCTISDNGIGRSNAAMIKDSSSGKTKSMGLNITKNRIDLINEKTEQQNFIIHDLVDETGKPAGTKVILKIRIEDSEHMQTA